MSNNKYNTSFDDLYMQYHRIVYGVSLSILHNEEAAKDIVQEVFMRLYQWRGRIKDESKIKGWLCVTSRNLSLNSLRKISREVSLTDIYASDSDPEKTYVKKEEHIKVHKAMSTLKDSYSEILSLRYGLDFTVQEIASVMNIPVATAYSRLHRAETALKNVLKEAEE